MRSLLPPLESQTIEQLAEKKLLIVLSSTGGAGFLLFWLAWFAAVATPFVGTVAQEFAPYALGLSLLLPFVLAGIFYLARGRLLASWCARLPCPNCQDQIPLISYWQCIGGCPTRHSRHVLSPCPTCGTKNQGILCPACNATISFADSYNEFEVANRGKKYVTQYNLIFWVAAASLVLITFLGYLSFQADLMILCYFFAVIAAGLVICLIALKPKRLAENPHYQEVQQWTRKATA
jgi:hypothetical protein